MHVHVFRSERRPPRSLSRAAALIALSALAGACGGRALDPDAADGSVGGGGGGSGGDAGAGDASSACGPRPKCATDPRCPGPCDCQCDPGTRGWRCTKRPCEDPQPPPPAPCPIEPPVAGTPCPIEGQICNGFDKCAPQCGCEGGRWACDDNPCGVPCPAKAPYNEPCNTRGQVCRYTGFCAPTCTCAPLTPQDDVWRCVTPPC
jgi:hypothetical protein